VSWGGLPTKRGKTLFVTLEDPVEVILYRIQKIARRFRLSYSDIEANVEILSYSEQVRAALAEDRMFNGSHEVRMTRIFDEIKAAATEGKFDVVMIDNASDGYHAGENTRANVSQFVRALAIGIGRTDRNRHIAVLLLAHVDKATARNGGSNGNDFSGSTAWHNSTRSRVALSGTEDATALEHQKSNLRPTHEPIPMVWVDGLLEPTTVEAQAAAEARQGSDDDEAVLTMLQSVIGRGRVVTAATAGPVTAYSTLAVFPEMPADIKNHKDARQRVHSAIERLIHAGRLRREEYRNDDHKVKARLGLAEVLAEIPPTTPTTDRQ
jgi:RecA-family ATPase